MAKIVNSQHIARAKRQYPGKAKTMTLSDNLKNSAEILKTKINDMIPDTGYFRTFAEDFANTDNRVYAKAISLAVKKDPNVDGKAYLSINLLHPTMNLNKASDLAYGNREQLISKINEPDFLENLEKKILQMSEGLKDMER